MCELFMIFTIHNCNLQIHPISSSGIPHGPPGQTPKQVKRFIKNPENKLYGVCMI